MHAILLTVLALGAGAGEYPVQQAAYGCEQCDSGHCGHAKAEKRPHAGFFGMMPQTCYEPHFGCYDGDRHMHRYPAFHGTYYRRAYNYRNYFDYPWHAEMHEPTSHYSYHTTSEMLEQGSAPPQPVPDAAARTQSLHDNMRSALRSTQPVYQGGEDSRTLRR
ncbi:hypothetical protein Psta_1092 [Pirellula staleyi DSM 6068]|uniref:Uncharacterized protein n=1 Tax=Pirellula staleyi (strain ATCC 27377 / DSM 6068 / ICPB 4128) TaxID=530564 RepID=D2R8F8_PIRSD|nr:hypothetical protein [Pirellula staleyi]ADB15775.1 hypothetical protein Psta_1092 [Pirellula staleyi DSM 6068]